MSQEWQAYDPQTDSKRSLHVLLRNNAECLLRLFSGGTEPDAAIRVPYMPWQDSSSGSRIYLRNSADDAWRQPWMVAQFIESMTVTSTANRYLIPPWKWSNLEAIYGHVYGSVSGTFDGSNYGAWRLINISQSLEMFSGAGNEARTAVQHWSFHQNQSAFTRFCGWKMTPDQNHEDLSWDDVIILDGQGATGSPGLANSDFFAIWSRSSK
jgi:hypothetical protein